MSILKVCVAGATGWAGSELSRAIVKALDRELVAAVSRSKAGHTHFWNARPEVDFAS